MQLLLLAADVFMVCGMAQLVAVVPGTRFQSCFSLHSNTLFFQRTPWPYCRIYGDDFIPTMRIIHTRKLPACAEPRWVLARRGEAPFVYIIFALLFSFIDVTHIRGHMFEF